MVSEFRENEQLAIPLETEKPSQFPELEITDEQADEAFGVSEEDILGDDDGNFSDVLEISEDENRTMFNVTQEDVNGRRRPKKPKYRLTRRDEPPPNPGVMS